MLSLIISTINSIKATIVKQNRTNWDKFVQGFLELGHVFRAYKNRKVALFNLTQFEGGRKKSNANLLFGLVLDWDGDLTIEEIEEWLDGWEYIMFSSFRHREDGETDKIKTIIPFLKPCSIDEWSIRLEGAKRYFRGCDPSSLTLTQFQAMPNCPKSRRSVAFTRHIKGEFFDWRLIPIIVDEIANETEESYLPPQTNIDTHSSRTIIAPDTVIHYKGGHVRAGDISEHIRDVFCPNHNDNNPTEFASVNDAGKPYIVCSSCGTLWIQNSSSQDDSIFPEIDVSIKSVDNKFSVEQPLDWNDTLKVLQNISGELTRRNVLLWPEGTGKSYLANIISQEGRKVIFACRSNKQAHEKMDSFSELGLSVKMLSSRSHEIEMKYDVKPVRYAKAHPWDEGRIDEPKSYKKIIERNPELSEFSINELLSDIVDSSLDWKTTDIVVTTHARLGHLGRLNVQRSRNDKEPVVPDDVVIFYDDPDNEDFMTLSQFISTVKKLTVFGQPIETYYPKTGNSFYYVKPPCIQPGYGFNNHQFIITTTELTILALIKLNFPDITIHDQLLPNDHKIFGGNIHMISTKLVRSSVDGILPPIMERIRRLGFEFEYIANGQGCEVNLSNNKGMNQFIEKNLVIEISVPTLDEVRTLHEQFDRKITQKKIKFLIMLDRIHQAVGRNSGYRWKGKECVVLIDPIFFKLAQQYSRYSFESVIEGDKENPELFPSKQPKFDSIHSVVGWYINRHTQYIRNGNEFKFDCQKCLKTISPNLRNSRLKRLLTALSSLKAQNPALENKIDLIIDVIEPEDLQ